MLSKSELIAELKNIMLTIRSLTFNVVVVQDDLYEMMADVVCEELKDGGILKHRLKAHKDSLEISLSHFNELVRLNWERKIDNDPV